ncbi:MAG TPA: molybdopterin converting factor subunit 1 [Anaerolineales bacterium]|nr:molybdopterin converting factor subunit 1 [Anaerolineales bacterium]
MENITVLFFATLRDRAGVRSVKLQIPAQTNIAGFKSILTEKFPALTGLTGHMLISINQEYVFDEAIVPGGAEIALFPPVSGG